MIMDYPISSYIGVILVHDIIHFKLYVDIVIFICQWYI